MVYLIENKKGKNHYLLLVKSTRKGSKVVKETIQSLGKVDRKLLKEEKEAILDSYHNKDWILKKEGVLSYQDNELKIGRASCRERV